MIGLRKIHSLGLPNTVSDIAEGIGMENAETLDLVDDLIKSGLVEMTGTGSDFRLTPKGKKWL